MKKCFKCEEEKPLSEFYKHSKMLDGHLNKCKDCTKKDVSENYQKNIDYYRAYEKTEKRKKSHNERQKKYENVYRSKYPKRCKARKMVGNAIRDGILIRPNKCECCESTLNIQGHHDDYNKPLDVRWLCAVCHRRWHLNNKIIRG